jgi:uncharacterized surface protein with fasciclin (FAS1) repeats
MKSKNPNQLIVAQRISISRNHSKERHMRFRHQSIFLLLLAGLIGCPQATPTPITTVGTSKTVYDIIASDSRLSTLKASLTPAQVAFLSDKKRTLTVFAAQNSAFADAAFSGLNAAKPSGKTLENVINTNILPVSLNAAALKQKIDPVKKYGQVENALGEDVFLESDGKNLFVDSGYYDAGFLDTYATGATKLVVTDLTAVNGVVHITDTLVLNATVAETAFASIGTAGAESAFDAKLAGLGAFTTLRGNGAFTFFLPYDTDFEALPLIQRDCLSGNAAILQKVLNHNILEGQQLLVTDLAGKTSVTTKHGDTITISKNAAGQVLLDGITIKANDANGDRWRDLIGRNGVTHYTDGLLIPSDVNLVTCQ